MKLASVAELKVVHNLGKKEITVMSKSNNQRSLEDSLERSSGHQFIIWKSVNNLVTHAS